MSVISALGRQWQVNCCKIKSSLVYIGSFQPENWILEGKKKTLKIQTKKKERRRKGEEEAGREEEEQKEKKTKELKIRKDRRINKRS